MILLGLLEGMALQELDILKRENADLKEQLVLTSTNFYQTTDKNLYNEVNRINKRTKKCRRKVMTFFQGDENFVLRKNMTDENVVRNCFVR